MLTFRAVACDYDGTLASHDHLAPGVVDALEQARAAGLQLSC
jgi:hydroxymethylpyrimidine pyrophosphatase-like HAD family hydrolase